VAAQVITPSLTLPAIMSPRQPFPDENLANADAIDFDMSKCPADFVCPAAFDDADLVGCEQPFESLGCGRA
jgi:hypothetical protein